MNTMRLICLTYAGGNKYSYRNFMPYLSEHIEMITLELPGRGTRMLEDLITDLDVLTDDLFRQMQAYLDKDYVLFGHSMGAMLGNLLLHKLRDEQQRLPQLFIATGCPSPEKRGLKTKIAQLSNAAFQQEIIKLGGMPDEVIQNQELLDFVLPVLRSDIKAIETKVYEQNTPYPVPIKAFCGTEETTKEADLTGWQLETSKEFSFEFLEGDHFFILNHLEKITEIINNYSVEKPVVL
ncbi:putative Surfactin synthase thioesterase subunit [Tenacibaculum litopenaei]